MSARRVGVVGGGVSGLVAARRLAADCEVELFEAGSDFGGKLRTTRFRERPLDLGADAFLVRNPAALELAGELGLGASVIHPASRSAAIWARGRLRPLPPGLAIGIPTDWRALWSSRTLSRAGALRAALDLLRRRPLPILVEGAPGSADPSVADLLGGRLGKEVLRVLVDPLIGGINASDIAELSLRSALPQLAPLLSGARSVMRALAPLASRAGAATARPPVFAGLEGGVASLVDALVGDCAGRGVALHRELAVTALSRVGSRWELERRGGGANFDALVLALPAPGARALLAEVAPSAAAAVGSIPYAGVVTATFAFRVEAVPARVSDELGAIADEEATSASSRALPGSGVLVPRASGRLLTAASFTSTKWPRSAAEDEVVIRASAGRHGDERALSLDDDDLAVAVLEDLSVVLGITEAPLERVICRYPASLPQYVPGHADAVAALRAALQPLPPVVVTGAAYDGIGIPACVASATREAERLVDALSR